MTPAFDRVDHLHVHVTDRVAAEAWYADVMGLGRMPELEHWSADGGPLTLTNPSGTVHVALFERPAPSCGHPTIALAASPAEFTAWRRHLEQKLARPIGVEDHGLAWSLYFGDPDGNAWEITCWQHALLATMLQE